MAKKELLVILLALFACFCLAMAGCSTNELTVTITNKESLTADWSEGGPDRTIEFTVRRGGENVEGAEYTVSSDNSGVVSVDGTTLKAVSAGTATITVASGDASDSVQITVSLALKAVTINAAYQYFEENEKGSLRAGKRADLVILSANPLTVAPDDLRSIEVLETIKDGETLFAK